MIQLSCIWFANREEIYIKKGDPKVNSQIQMIQDETNELLDMMLDRYISKKAFTRKVIKKWINRMERIDDMVAGVNIDERRKDKV